MAVLAEEARDDALERWLRQGFGDPDGFADALLLERISDQDAPVAEELRFLRAAEVPADAHQHVELAIDRRVLLAQASPWRYVEGDAFAAALAAVRAWRQRYERAYAAHYRAVVVALEEVRRTLRESAGAVAALERLNGVRGLGAPVGEAEIAAYRAAEATLEAMPADPTSGAARTAGVTLGREPPLGAQAGAAVEGVRRGLEEQRGRLASATVRLVLARPGVAALDRLLQAIAASDLDGLERGLSDELAAYIGDLLADGRPTPLKLLVERYPEVTSETLNDVTSMFHALLEDGLARSEDGRMRLN